jgi:hypothetical protein
MDDDVRKHRTTYLHRPQLMVLDAACRPMRLAFGHVYLVGSCMARQDYRDVDVRVLVDARTWEGMFPAADPESPYMDARWELLCMALSEHLRRASGLPVDLQFQELAVANRQWAGHPRNPLGTRWRPDGR